MNAYSDSEHTQQLAADHMITAPEDVYVVWTEASEPSEGGNMALVIGGVVAALLIVVLAAVLILKRRQ